MSVSGRAGLFTMDDGRFFGDLRGTPYTSNKRQASGALRVEFGRLTLTDAGMTSATVRTTINTGIITVVSPEWLPIVTTTSGAFPGTFNVASPGSYLSGIVDIRVAATGQFSGQNSGMAVNYMVIGY